MKKKIFMPLMIVAIQLNMNVIVIASDPCSDVMRAAYADRKNIPSGIKLIVVYSDSRDWFSDSEVEKGFKLYILKGEDNIFGYLVGHSDEGDPYYSLLRELNFPNNGNGRVAFKTGYKYCVNCKDPVVGSLMTFIGEIVKNGESWVDNEGKHFSDGDLRLHMEIGGVGQNIHLIPSNKPELTDKYTKARWNEYRELKIRDQCMQAAMRDQ